MLEFLVVGAGGFLGSCMRFALTRFAQPLFPNFPGGTLLSNVIAGVAIGLVIGWEQQHGAMNPKANRFLTTGLLGGLSTFSTFSVETIQLFQEGRALHASGNVALNLGLSLVGVVLGMAVPKLVMGMKL
ncbi:MAG: fluoride efflux transporter CrcB [Myxococcales bacterium]|jgi:CrcB protein|nr:fluoride efflux transporter CrcB [Myxococcales bacterium]